MALIGNVTQPPVSFAWDTTTISLSAWPSLVSDSPVEFTIRDLFLLATLELKGEVQVKNNVDYSLRSRRCQKRIAPVVAEFHRKRKELLQAEYQAQLTGEPLVLPPSQEPHEPE